jgi:hypothetical protein
MRVHAPPRPILRTVQKMLRLSGCARGRRRACGGEAAGRAVTTHGLWRVVRAGFCFRLQARVSFSPKVGRSGKASKLSAFHLV